MKEQPPQSLPGNMFGSGRGNEGIVFGVAQSERCSGFGSLADNFLLVGVRFIEPVLSGAINVAPTIFDFWLKILMLAAPNPRALGNLSSSSFG